MIQESESPWEDEFAKGEIPVPALSLEISNLPPILPSENTNNSVNNNENPLVTLLSPRNGKHTQPAMEIACKLVHSLLDQVSWNDSPPSNEELSRKKDKTPKKTGLLSQQCHVQQINESPTSAHNAQHSPAYLWREQYNRRCNIAEQKMGNVALAALCARTLETLGKPSLPSKESVPKTVMPALSSSKDIGSQKKKTSRKPQWQGGLRRDNSTQSKNAIFFAPEDASEAREEANSESRVVKEKRDDEKPKLQMFGSEYARYLSTTAFAPKDLSSPKSMALKSFPIRKKKMSGVERLEDASNAVLTGAITDIVITHGSDMPPKGFLRISQSANGEAFYLHDKQAPAHIHIKKESNWDRAAQRPCVTALTLIFPERKEFVPPGFNVVRRHSTPKGSLKKSKDADTGAANLNYGGEPVFLCFRRSREGNPITGLIPLLPKKGEHVPQGYTVLERTPRNNIAGISTSASKVFFAYRQRLLNLETLRPIPLVMSVHQRSRNYRKLNAYYCTGGTIVESRVGQFHVMDRSTHSLLSPKSVSNRLSMIEASRKKILDSLADLPSGSGNTYQYSGGNPRSKPKTKEMLASSLLVAPGLGTPGSVAMMSDLENLSTSEDHESFASFFGGSRVSESDVASESSPLNHQLRSDGDDSSQGSIAKSVRSIAKNDKDLKRCLDAMSFIPMVSSATGENYPREMLNFQARVAILIPVLTACYTRHGGSALLAVEGLSTLLDEDFFANDMTVARDASSRITLLDIAVQVVCDVATTGTLEAQMPVCVAFVTAAVKTGCGHLNTRTVGYVMRLYLFVFYFGVSIPSGDWALIKGRDNFLLLDPRSSTVSYLPGGAPQAAALAFKELITYSISRLRSLVLSDRDAAAGHVQHKTSDENVHASPVFNSLIDELVKEAVDGSVYRVDVANFTQLALHQIHRAGGSELFWYDMMNTCGEGLFGSDEVLKDETRHTFSICFAILTHCVKVASSAIRRGKNGMGVPRDIASKLMSLEMIDFFLQKWDTMRGALDVPKSRAFATFIYCVRRLVVPCLLLNTQDSLQDPRVFKRLIRILGTLVLSETYRTQMKLEIRILIEHFVVSILKLGPQILLLKPSGVPHLFAQQLELMVQMKSWFSSSPETLLELFLNYDSSFGLNAADGETKFVSGHQWNLCHEICSCVCDISEQCGEYLGIQIEASHSMSASKKLDAEAVIQGMSGTTLARESAERLRNSAVLLATQIAQCLAKLAASSRGKRFKQLADSWILEKVDGEDDDAISLTSASMASIVHEALADDEIKRKKATSLASPENKNIIGYWKKRASRKQSYVQQSDEAAVAASVETSVASTEGNVALVRKTHQLGSSDEEAGSQSGDHLSVAFEIAEEKNLRKAIEYLVACDVLTSSPRDIASFLRIHRGNLKASDLGNYIGEGGSNTGEIERWNMIRFCFVRAISFVGMSVEKGLRHLLTNGGFRLPGEAQKIDRIIATFSACYWEDNAGDHAHCPFQDQDSVFLLSFAMIMLNTDLHKSKSPFSSCSKQQPKKMSQSEFVSNLRGVLLKQDWNAGFLSTVYASIASCPIVMREEESNHALGSNDLSMQLESLIKNAKSADALLRGFSVHEYRFIGLKEFAEQEYDGASKSAERDVTRKMMKKTWHLFHGLINAGLDLAYLDVTGLELFLDLLKYMLSMAVCLELPIERAAFLAQLVRFQQITNANASAVGGTATNSDCSTSEEWSQSIDSSCVSNDKGKLESLGRIRQLVQELSLGATTDALRRNSMKAAVGQLKNAEFLLSDPNRTFVRQADLVKQANTTGRYVQYRFILFSDVLIYAKRIAKTQQYKAHEELPLLQMKIVDWFPPESKDGNRAFQVFHPCKKVMVVCADSDEKRSWVESLRSAIESELHRKVAVEAARIVASAQS